MQIVMCKLNTSGPQEYMLLDVDPSVAATGTVFVCYKDASGYTVMTFTTDSAPNPTKTLETGVAELDAVTAFTDWQALQPA